LEALSDLPLELFRLPASVLERLGALGLQTTGDVLKLPRETLVSRFGEILPQRLDQALGLRAELFSPERLREPLMVVHQWDEPLEDRHILASICRHMLQKLLSEAQHPGAGFQELEGELFTEAGPVKLLIRLARPSRDEGHLAGLMELQMERCTLPAGVVSVRWIVSQFGHLAESAHNWFDCEVEFDGSREVAALVDRISCRLGEDAVLRLEALPEAQPECAIQQTPWTKARAKRLEEYLLPADQSRCRPFRLLFVPQVIEVVSVVPDGPPVRITWRKEVRQVVRAWGPERIASGWWRSSDVQRDYYRTEWDDGIHAWVYRDLRKDCWFLHGFFE
jgi:protein ImuB